MAPYFDLSFQHSSEPVLRRMRRFGSTERFLELLGSARALDPQAGARSNVIVGFPGETRADVAELERFLTEARLDAIGVFDYSDEDGTEAAGLPGKVGRGHRSSAGTTGSARWPRSCATSGPRSGSGTEVDVLVESVAPTATVEGRAAHQAPEVDGSTTPRPADAGRPAAAPSATWSGPGSIGDRGRGPGRRTDRDARSPRRSGRRASRS